MIEHHLMTARGGKSLAKCLSTASKHTKKFLNYLGWITPRKTLNLTNQSVFLLSLQLSSVTLSVISIIAVSGNFVLIAAFLRALKTKKTSSNWYMMNMAISNVGSVLLNWPLYETEGMLKPEGSLITNQVIATLFCKLRIYSRTVFYMVGVNICG